MSDFVYREEEIPVVDAFINLLYKEAGRPIVGDRYADQGSGVWMARYLRNRQDMGPHAAAAKTFGELRAGLGLGVDPANPFPPDPAPPEPPVPPGPVIPYKATDRLHVDGSTLRHEDGSFAFLLGPTAFPILDFFIREGPTRIAPFVDAAIDYLGYGCEFRALGMAHGVVGSWTVDYPGANAHIVTKYREQELLYGIARL